jgi:ATP-binding cassette subfamily F protein uup
MNYLSVENIAKRYGDRLLFEDVSFGIDKGQKVAFIAKNGSGKTTLLRALAGIEPADSGNVVFRNGISVGFLAQDQVFDPNLTIHEVIHLIDSPAFNAKATYDACLANGAEGDDFHEAMEAMERTGAWDIDMRMDAILSKLKLTDQDKKVSQLSGGQVKRLALAQVLIFQPDFVILDEPTNHLDLDMIEWLETYLDNTNMTLFMVTHDRYFLERVCDVILELDNQTIYRYKGNYSYYLEKKAERQEIEQVNIDKAKNLMSTELEWIRRQPKARGTKSKSRVDAFQDIKTVATKRVDKDSMEMEVNMTRIGSKILEFHKVQKAYGDLPILNQFDYTFKKGERIGIIGKNGVGKTTFLNMITGKEPADGGKIVVGDTIVFGYYSQQGMKFKDDQRIIDAVKDIAEIIPLTKGKKITASQLLERFLFPTHMHYQYISKLSGGEKRRLYLLTIFMANPNFLILDEPTNDLDVFTINVLEDFLLSYPGCLLVVSHDRFFMDKMVDHLFVFKGEGKVKDYPGNYTLYRAAMAQEKKDKKALKDSKPKAVVAAPVVAKPKAPTQKISYKEKVEFEQLEKDIESLETEKANLTKQLSSGELDNNELMEVSSKMTTVVDSLDDKSMRWLELSEKA